MNVLSFSSAYVGSGHNAGAETTLHDLLTLLKSRKHNTTALLSKTPRDGSGSYVIDGIKVQAYASKQDPFLYFPQSDLVISQLECAQRTELVARPLGVPTIQYVHNYTPYSLGISQWCDVNVYNTANVQSACEAYGTKKRSMVFHPYINPERYKVDHPTLDDGGYVTLVNLSNGTAPFYDKGYRVFYRLAKKYPQYQFLGVRGAYGTQHIEELPNVTIIDHTLNMLDVYRQTAVLLVPSTIESFGRVAVEAAASGIPSISTDLPGPREAGVSWTYIPAEDHWVWECALDQLADEYNRASVLTLIESERLWRKTSEQSEHFLSLVDRMVT